MVVVACNVRGVTVDVGGVAIMLADWMRRPLLGVDDFLEDSAVVTILLLVLGVVYRH